MRYSRDFTITREEMQGFYRMLVLRRWKKGILGFAVVGALVARLYLNWLNLELGAAWEIVLMLLTAVLTAVFITFGMMLRTRRNVDQLMRKNGRGSYVQQTRIDGFGLHVTVGKESAKLPFEKIQLVQETKDAFYIFLTADQAWILPKAQMEDKDAECAALRGIFTRVVAPARRKLQK